MRRRRNIVALHRKMARNEMRNFKRKLQGRHYWGSKGGFLRALKGFGLGV